MKDLTQEQREALAPWSRNSTCSPFLGCSDVAHGLVVGLRLPFQVVWFTEPKPNIRSAPCVHMHQPDVIYCQLVRCAEYVKDLHDIPKVLDYMDALSAGMHRRAHTETSLGQAHAMAVPH